MDLDLLEVAIMMFPPCWDRACCPASETNRPGTAILARTSVGAVPWRRQHRESRRFSQHCWGRQDRPVRRILHLFAARRNPKSGKGGLTKSEIKRESSRFVPGSGRKSTDSLRVKAPERPQGAQFGERGD